LAYKGNRANPVLSVGILLWTKATNDKRVCSDLYQMEIHSGKDTVQGKENASIESIGDLTNNDV
jgi:hypothetical protein